MTRTSAAQPRSTGYPGYTLTGRRAPETAVEGRRLTRVALAAWGLVNEEDSETAALVMSELVANAVRHAHGLKIRMTVDRPADNLVYVAVVDWAPRRLPVLREPSMDAAQGRGLLLVEAVADRWGYDFMGPGVTPWGKRVWAELQVQATP